jgi:UDP-N-acetylmuramate: L-alanyl-gamma-D-glutamyl-meso-diaminopimelate ligase
MNVHFIAIGGSAMHNLAIALRKKGYDVSGSDDEIFEPSKSRLKKCGLLPEKEGWDSGHIHNGLDAVILGMHARKDNPELIKASELNLKIYSYPEYLYEQSKGKTRVVIAGSHGKTTITAMVLHVLEKSGVACDYMVGAQLEGFEVMVRLTEDAPYMILEGDEYLSSPMDPRPKFHLYHPNIALITGIAWDHINVFPTFENYIEQFQKFIDLIEKNGFLVYCSDDAHVDQLAGTARKDITRIPYSLPDFRVTDGITYLLENNTETSLQIFGRHNLANLNGASKVCKLLGVSDKEFLNAIGSFKGASKRLQLVGRNVRTAVYKDFAHSPSKLKATTSAMKQQFPDRQLIACLELHTFSSLSEKFLDQYIHCLDDADIPIVYFNPHAIALKKLPPITPDQVKRAFGIPELKVYTDSSELLSELSGLDYTNKNLLMMSSGDFDGINIEELANLIVK